MYTAIISNSKKQIQGQTVKDLLNATGKSSYGSTSASNAISDLINCGEIIPVSGPDWFMALKADDKLAEEIEQRNREQQIEDAKYAAQEKKEMALNQQMRARCVELAGEERAAKLMNYIIGCGTYGDPIERSAFSSSEKHAAAIEISKWYWNEMKKI